MTIRTVSLAMYTPADPDALDVFWQGLRSHLATAGFDDIAVDLDRPSDLSEHWTSPRLLLGQTCGYPLTHELQGRVRLVGTPSYEALGCEGATYTSLFVVRTDDAAKDLADLKGRRAAFNDTDSQSGYNALRHAVAPLATAGRFFGATVETGAHRRSMRAVLDGEADIAAIDCVTYALSSTEADDATAGLRILSSSRRVPGLPLITSLETSDADVKALRAALSAACRDPGLAEARRRMLLSGFEVLPDGAYDALVEMEDEAVALGYPVLA